MNSMRKLSNEGRKKTLISLRLEKKCTELDLDIKDSLTDSDLTMLIILDW